ncbi:hypothetical protein ACFX19_017184 [Malus domestica]
MLGEQPGKGSGQSVPDQKFDFMFQLIVFFLLVLQSTLKKGSMVFGKLMLRVKIVDKFYPRKSGSRSSESGASLVFEQAILLGIWLSRFGERCLFDF